MIRPPYEVRPHTATVTAFVNYRCLVPQGTIEAMLIEAVLYIIPYVSIIVVLRDSNTHDKCGQSKQ